MSNNSSRAQNANAQPYERHLFTPIALRSQITCVFVVCMERRKKNIDVTVRRSFSSPVCVNCLHSECLFRICVRSKQKQKNTVKPSLDSATTAMNSFSVSKCSNGEVRTVFFISVTFMGIYLAFHDGAALSIKSLAHTHTHAQKHALYLSAPLYSSFKIRLGANRRVSTSISIRSKLVFVLHPNVCDGCVCV